MRVLLFSQKHDNRCDLIRNAIMEVRNDSFHHFLPKDWEFVEIDVDEKRSLAESMQATKVPKLFLQHDGNIVAEFKELPTKSNMLKFLKKINTYRKSQKTK
jgi:thioredoxin-like negative regulator of GroEL